MSCGSAARTLRKFVRVTVSDGDKGTGEIVAH